MKKKDLLNIATATFFFTTMLAVILIAFEKNKILQTRLFDSEADENEISQSSLSIQAKIDRKLNEAATKIKNRGSNFSIPSGEFGTFL